MLDYGTCDFRYKITLMDFGKELDPTLTTELDPATSEILSNVCAPAIVCMMVISQHQRFSNNEAFLI